MATTEPSGQAMGAATPRAHSARSTDRPVRTRVTRRTPPHAVETTAARRRSLWYRDARSSFIVAVTSVQLHRDQLRHAGLLHRHPVEAVGDLHRLAVVGDENELGVLLHALEHLDEAADVGVVERRVDLVEQAERARAVLEDGEHQRHRGEGLLAARKELNALQALARRRGDDVDAALERVAFVEWYQAGLAVAVERGERPGEVLVDDGERLLEALPRRLVDLADRLVGRRNRVDEVLALRGQERVARLEVVELIDRHHVHGAHSLDLD